MVSGLQQVDPPQDFFGGVIADPMGFGKTLAMIALIATDNELEHSPSNDCISRLMPTSSNLTLVVVPAPSEL